MLPRTENDFLNYCIPAGRTMGSSRDVPNSIFYYWYPVSLLRPNSSVVGSDPTLLCGFRHALANVSERHGTNGSTVAMFFPLLYGPLSGCGAHNLSSNGTEHSSLDTEKV